jgi:hypothetical protein
MIWIPIGFVYESAALEWSKLDNFHRQVEIRAEAVHLFLFVKEEENGACLRAVQVRASIHQVRVHSK